ncbi:MAG TPA: hypothetical protein VFI61_00500 [Patescibacteria group bacterium]|nr:hypothetical protein [Patescibacteria group bacterium]
MFTIFRVQKVRQNQKSKLCKFAKGGKMLISIELWPGLIAFLHGTVVMVGFVLGALGLVGLLVAMSMPPKGKYMEPGLMQAMGPMPHMWMLLVPAIPMVLFGIYGLVVLAFFVLYIQHLVKRTLPEKSKRSKKPKAK